MSITKMPRYEKIRSSSTTVNGNRFAVSEWEKKVQVWDIEKGFVCKIETDIISGMSNAISISESGNQLAIAGYDQNTITLYDIDKGTISWQRKDLKEPATVIILNRYLSLIFIDTENHGAFFLDRETGKTIERLQSIEFVRENSYSNIDQFERKSVSTLINRTNRSAIGSFKHKSFAILDACFSSDKIICSYSGNPLEAVSLTSFQTLWTTRVVGHFLEIEYCKELNKILGIRWEYETGGPKFLSYINIDNGFVEKEINIGEPNEVGFLKRGQFLLTSQGNLYSTISGQIVNHFEFS